MVRILSENARQSIRLYSVIGDSLDSSVTVVMELEWA